MADRKREKKTEPKGEAVKSASTGSRHDSVSARERLQSEVLDGQWQDLKPHAERAALFILEPGHDIVEVGAAIVEDDVATIDEHLQNSVLTRPTSEQMRQWDLDTAKPFRILIVAPYVLIQVLPH